MLKYDIAALVGKRSGKVILPPIADRKTARAEYLKILRSMLREIGQQGRTAKTAFEFELLSQVAARLALTSDGLVQNILKLEAKKHTETFKAVAKRSLGVDLAQVVVDEDLTDYLKAAGMRNAGLIKGLGMDAVKRVQETVSTALISGSTARDVQAKLTEQLRISDRRAQLIATDQMAKLTSDLNRIRHEQAGITEYSWMTSHDERVRPRHRALDGKVYTYGQPTGAEEGLPPGQPIRCRCIARAIVQF